LDAENDSESEAESKEGPKIGQQSDGKIRESTTKRRIPTSLSSN
jgi:hypothetical protein